MRPSNSSRTHSNDEIHEIEDSNFGIHLRRGSSSCEARTLEYKRQKEADNIVQDMRNREGKSLQ